MVSSVKRDYLNELRDGVLGMTPSEFRRLYISEFLPSSDVYVSGYEAARMGLEISSCPYHREDGRREEWRSGFKEFRKYGR